MTRRLGHISELDTSLLSEPGCVSFSWTHSEQYRAEGTSIDLHVLMFIDNSDIWVAISTSAFAATDIDDATTLHAAAREAEVSAINLRGPLALNPVYIEKPWGQEIWYSGIEARGVSLVDDTPIAWVLDIFGAVIGCEGAPLLLKILDPLATENLGDLYFEMHEEKIEVYVVTRVDPQAWPDGRGAIRYGFNQKKVAEFSSKEAFLEAYVDKVSTYQACRDEIDALQKEGTSYLEHLNGLPSDLVSREQQLRAEMYEFTQLVALETGDVVTVRPLVPHSLQHGVRVVEFQTPHYERYILSFGQKVVTQDHWDTEEVLEKANTEAVTFDQPVELGPGEDLIADFEEFRVVRKILPPADTTTIVSERYAMVMGIQGLVLLSGKRLEPETAYLVPRNVPVTLSNETESPAIYLVAEEA